MRYVTFCFLILVVILTAGYWPVVGERGGGEEIAGAAVAVATNDALLVAESMSRCVFDDWSISVAEHTGRFVWEEVGGDLDGRVHRAVAGRRHVEGPVDAEAGGSGEDGRAPVVVNRPNPFDSSTEIAFTLPRAGHATVRVYDALGVEVATLTDAFREEGTYLVAFDGSRFDSGVYACRLEAGGKTVIRDLILIK